MRTVKPVPYNVTMKNGPNYGKTVKGVFNDHTHQFITEGYTVFRNFIPKEMIEFSMDVWKTIEHHPLADQLLEAEVEAIPNGPESSKYTTTAGHTMPMGVAMHRYIHKKLRKEFDMQLIETYSYSRKYTRGSYLRAHADRPSCEVSATICLDYESEDGEPWVIWVDNTRNWVDEDISQCFDETQGIPIRHR